MVSFDYIEKLFTEEINSVVTCRVLGKVVQVSGDVIKVTVPYLRVGERCILRNPQGNLNLEAEVIGFVKDGAILSPIGSTEGISSETEVIATGRMQTVPVGKNLIGRVLNGLGQPIDGKGAIYCEKRMPIYNAAPQAMKRKIIREVLPLGVKALDCFLTMGKGQRMGVFAAAGVGKSKLLSSLVRGAKADIIVLALIGERGREVREFIEYDIGKEGMKRSVIVCSTSDRSSVERAKAAYMATSIAEYFRDQGQDVLLLMDSVTRFARALREIGLSAGEPPARRGFPPSVFAMLPRLMERAGNSSTGSISAIYTVLVEGDDMTEPVADETRSILDGHIVLSRKLAAANHYPAIDILESVSRVMDTIVAKEHSAAARRVRTLIDKYQEVDLLIKIGEYKPGGDEVTDEAVAKHPLIEGLLKQQTNEIANDFDATIKKLLEVSE